MRSDCTRWSFHFKWKKRLNNIEFRWVFGLWERNSSVSLQQSGPEECKSSIDLVTDVRLIYLSVTALRLSHNTHTNHATYCVGLLSAFAWANFPPSSSSLASCYRVSLLWSSSQWPPAGRRHPQHGYCPPPPGPVQTSLASPEALTHAAPRWCHSWSIHVTFFTSFPPSLYRAQLLLTSIFLICILCNLNFTHVGWDLGPSWTRPVSPALTGLRFGDFGGQGNSLLFWPLKTIVARVEGILSCWESILHASMRGCVRCVTMLIDGLCRRTSTRMTEPMLCW